MEMYVKVYSETSQTSKMEVSADIVNGRKQLTKWTEYSILDVWKGPEYPSGMGNCP